MKFLLFNETHLVKKFNIFNLAAQVRDFFNLKRIGFGLVVVTDKSLILLQTGYNLRENRIWLKEDGYTLTDIPTMQGWPQELLKPWADFFLGVPIENN